MYKILLHLCFQRAYRKGWFWCFHLPCLPLSALQTAFLLVLHGYTGMAEVVTECGEAWEKGKERGVERRVKHLLPMRQEGFSVTFTGMECDATSSTFIVIQNSRLEPLRVKWWVTAELTVEESSRSIWDTLQCLFLGNFFLSSHYPQSSSVITKAFLFFIVCCGVFWAFRSGRYICVKSQNTGQFN